MKDVGFASPMKASFYPKGVKTNRWSTIDLNNTVDKWPCDKSLQLSLQLFPKQDLKGVSVRSMNETQREDPEPQEAH